MAVVDGRTGMERLAPPACWELLSGSPVGRVGVLVDSAPEIYPVNFVVHAQTVLFRTDPGSKLAGLERSPAVCFEVDGIDVEERGGWSILVKGTARQLTSPAEVGLAAELHLHYWAHGPKSHWIQILPREVTGRRIRRP